MYDGKNTPMMTDTTRNKKFVFPADMGGVKHPIKTSVTVLKGLGTFINLKLSPIRRDLPNSINQGDDLSDRSVNGE